MHRWGTRSNSLSVSPGWYPVFARDGAEVPKGNQELLKQGAAALPESEFPSITDLPDWMRGHANSKPEETDLFGMAVPKPARQRKGGSR